MTLGVWRLLPCIDVGLPGTAIGEASIQVAGDKDACFDLRHVGPVQACSAVHSTKDCTGVARCLVGTCPVLDPATGATLVDALSRRSDTTSIAFGPTIGKGIAWFRCTGHPA